jgi:endonuclease/exonuclease/phosphatase (EEP) superfamily protein YafD
VTLLPNAPFGNERARFLVWTKLKSKKGEGRWVFANCHLLAGADYNDATRAVMRQQVGNIVAWLTRRPKARVVLCGDFNQVRRSTFLKPLVDAGLTSVHQVRPLMQPPTHRADIDHVWFRRTRSKVVSAKVLRRYPSDHKPLVVTLERCS